MPSPEQVQGLGRSVWKSGTWFYPTATAYLVSAGCRFFARLAMSTSSLTVTINASTVSGVKEGSPSSGQTHAQTFWTWIDIPSSLYSNTVCCHTFSVLCWRQIGGGLGVINYFFSRFRCLNAGGTHTGPFFTHTGGLAEAVKQHCFKFSMLFEFLQIIVDSTIKWTLDNRRG